MKPVIILDDAENELTDAVVLHEERRSGLGDLLRNAVYATRELVSTFPQIGARWPRTDCREFVMTEFPFSVIYRELDDVIEIVAFAHAKRRRGYWKSRLIRS